jgi:glutaredoxin
MTRSIRARWFNAGIFAVLAVVQYFSSNGSVSTTYVLPGLLLALAVWLSPVGSRSTNAISEAEAKRLVREAPDGDKPVIVYHRPGCTYCGRLKLALFGVRNRAHWVDIWEDEDAATYVRSVNNGNETVPTVVINGVVHSNPPPNQVRSALTGA